MTCSIPYIRAAKLSNTEQSRLEEIHISIFKEAKDSKAFREVDNRLQAIKSKYAEATAFVGRTNQKYGPVSRLNSIGNGNAVLSVDVLPLSNEQQAVLFQEEESKQSIASPEVIKKVKEVLKKMGTDVQSVAEYSKNTDYDLSGVSGVADITRNIIALAEGKEAEAITEEMVHIATSIIELANPKMVTEMIAKIDRFKIYKETFEKYKDRYKLSNGKPDVRRIKKEAVDKLISEIIVNQNENIEQYPELREEINQSLVRKWWTAILDWIKGAYRSSNINIFEEAAAQIMEGVGTAEGISGDVFFQLSDKQADIQKKRQATIDKVEKVPEEGKADPLLLDSEEANNFYRVKKEDGTWEKVKRVTDRVKAWYKERFGNKVFSAEEKKFNELKREYGVQGHADFEEIHSRYYNEDGTKREIPLDRPTKFNLPNREMYEKLEEYYVDLINSLPKNTLIFSEFIVYDEKEKEAGTLDFLAVEPSGKSHIFDWKFMSVNKGQEDVAWYKQGAYNIQIGRYKEILRTNYGIKEFGMMRAIPIIMDFKPEQERVKDSPLILKGIAIGTLDTSKVTTLTLLPVAEETESTGYVSLDRIIKTLNAYMKQLSKKKVTTEEDRQFRFERLNILNRAIRQAHITQNIAPLIEVMEVMRKEGDNIMEDYTTSYKDRESSSDDTKNPDLSDFAEEMRDYIKLSEIFINIGRELGPLVYSKEMEKEAKTEQEWEEIEDRKKIFNKLRDESDAIYSSRQSILEASKAFIDKHVGERNLVFGFLNPEKVLKGLGSIFRGVSELPLKSLEILTKLTRAAMGKASEDALKEIQELMSIRQKLQERGGNLRELVRAIYQKDDKDKLINKLINKYKTEFFAEVDKKANEGGDITWLKENINLDGYRKEAKEAADKEIEGIKRHRYGGTPEEEDITREHLITKVKQKYDIDRKDFNGWNNYIIKRHPQDKWISQEYRNVEKDPLLLELYNFVIKFNEKAKDIGYIENLAARTFLPFIRKSMAEQLAFDGNISVMQKFMQSIEMKVEDVGYGNFNEVTGELENSIPKYYTYDFTFKDRVNDYSDVSEDLFKNLILYIQQVNKYKYMSEIEGQLKLIKTIEEFKGHLLTGKSGNVIREGGKVKPQEGNAENVKMFDDFLRVMLYDQKYVLSDTDTPLYVGKVVNFVKKSINTVAGKEVLKVDDDVSPTSLIKAMDGLNRGFQMRTLGLDPLFGIVNWFGGNIQIAARAGNYFTVSEFGKNEAKLSLHNFATEEEKETFTQLVNTFMPLQEDPAYREFQKAGMSTLTKRNVGDILMVFMRKPEQLIEKSVFLTLLQNTMVVDGKMVNIREFVARKYKNRHTGTSIQRKQIKATIDKEIEELKKSSSIAVTRKLENGKLVIPGLNLSDRAELQRLTDLSRRITMSATGNVGKENINRMSMSIWTKSMMVFKNWIPPLLDTRFGEFRKVSDDFSVRIGEDGVPEGQKYDIGRIRLLGYAMMKMIQERSFTIINILSLNDKGIATLDQMFEEFRQKYENETGEELTISREDFIDLIRNNLQNQIRELAYLASLMGLALSLGFIAPDDEDDKSSRNAHRYAQRVIDKFVSELSFFYNPSEFGSLLSGSIFPSIGLIRDFQKFMGHFMTQITGIDFDADTTYDEARKKAMPIKYTMKMLPVLRPTLTYLSVFSDQFAEEFDITIQKETRK